MKLDNLKNQTTTIINIDNLKNQMEKDNKIIERLENGVIDTEAWWRFKQARNDYYNALVDEENNW